MASDTPTMKELFEDAPSTELITGGIALVIYVGWTISHTSSGGGIEPRAAFQRAEKFMAYWRTRSR